MKQFRIMLWVLSLVVLFGVACSNVEPRVEEPVWDEAIYVAYANIENIHTKADLANIDLSRLEHSLRNEVTSEERADIDQLMALLRNPSIAGIDVGKPAYIAIRQLSSDGDPKHASLALEICNAQALDTALESLGDKVSIENFTLEGDTRIIRFNATSYVGYNNERMVALHCDVEGMDPHSELLKLLTYLPADMSRFGSRDVALHIDTRKLFSIIVGEPAQNIEPASESEEQTDESSAEEELLGNFWEAYYQYLTDESTMIVGLTFENGSILLDSDISRINENANRIFVEANGSNLKMLDKSPIAILNAGINGEVASNLLNTAVDAAMELNQIPVSNEINIVKNIALGIVSSMQGDLTLALSDAEGRLIDDVFYGKKLVFTTANALFASEVKDDYIMQNISLYGGSFLQKKGPNKYFASMFGNNIHIGDKGNRFYVGVNNNGENKTPSASNEEWSNNVNGSYVYSMIDFKKLFNTSFGRAALSTICQNAQSSSERDLAKLFAERADHLFILCNGGEDYAHGEIMLTLVDGQTNALNQIITIANNL